MVLDWDPDRHSVRPTSLHFFERSVPTRGRIAFATGPRAVTDPQVSSSRIWRGLVFWCWGGCGVAGVRCWAASSGGLVSSALVWDCSGPCSWTRGTRTRIWSSTPQSYIRG